MSRRSSAAPAFSLPVADERRTKADDRPIRPRAALFQKTPEKWCPRADLNHRHADFQSAALPLSYSGYTAKTAWERSL